MGFAANYMGPASGFVAAGEGFPPIVISPSAPSVAALASQTFTTSGGSGTGYVYSLTQNQSGATLVGAVYTAGAAGGVDKVRVTDSANNHVDATITAAAWTPGTDARSFAWLDPAQGFVPGTGVWTDAIGGVVFSPGAAKPTRNASFVNGKPSIRFDGGSAYVAGSFTPFAQAFTIGILFRVDTAAALQFPFDGIDGSSSRVFLQNQANANIQINAGTTLNPPSADTSVLHLYACVFNGATSKIIVDGTTQVTGNAGTNGCNGLTVGAAFIQALGLNGGDIVGLVVAKTIAADYLAALHTWANANFLTP